MARKILIINLKRSGDIFTNAYFTHSLKSKYKNAEISLLIFNEFKPAADCVNGIQEVFTIDRKKLMLLFHNPLFTKAHAINQLAGELSEIINTDWDLVVNYSNDHTSAYLTSLLNTKEWSGVKVDEQVVVVPSNPHANLFNEVIQDMSLPPIHYLDMYAGMMGVNWKVVPSCVKSEISNNKLALENFNAIRKKHIHEKGPSCKIIGIQLKASMAEKDIPQQAILEVIESLNASKDFSCIVLLAPFENERKMLADLNMHFDHKLLSVEADFLALTSVLINLDALITPDTSVKHMADLTETPVLEVSLGPSPLHKQGTPSVNNMILTPIISMKEGFLPDLSGRDILIGLEYLMEGKSASSNDLHPDLTLYKVDQDANGILYRPVAGNVNVNDEMRYLASRCLCYKLMGDCYDEQTLARISEQFHKSEIEKWIFSEKEEATRVVRELLGTLRVLKQAKKDKQKGSEFLEKLDSLMAYCNSNYMPSIPLKLFRAEMESIRCETADENIEKMEDCLFALKNTMQNVSNILNDVEKIATDLDKQRKAKSVLDLSL